MGEKLTSQEVFQLSLLDRIEASKDKPAFWTDIFDLSRPKLNELVGLGLVSKARFKRYGWPRGERSEVGYWLTPAGRQALEDAGHG